MDAERLTACQGIEKLLTMNYILRKYRYFMRRFKKIKTSVKTYEYVWYDGQVCKRYFTEGELRERKKYGFDEPDIYQSNN